MKQRTSQIDPNVSIKIKNIRWASFDISFHILSKFLLWIFIKNYEWIRSNCLHWFHFELMGHVGWINYMVVFDFRYFTFYLLQVNTICDSNMVRRSFKRFIPGLGGTPHLDSLCWRWNWVWRIKLILFSLLLFPNTLSFFQFFLS